MTIADFDLTAFDFDITFYDPGPSSGVGGVAMASGTTNGIGWHLHQIPDSR